VSPKRGDRVAPPPAAGQWELRFATTEAVKGWEHHGGTDMEQWQFEVTSGGRIWYLVDTAKRTLWIRLATTGHPSQTG
jgi:hypothetical protein